MDQNQKRSRVTHSAWTPRFARIGDSAWSIVHKYSFFNGFRGPTTRRLLDLPKTPNKSHARNLTEGTRRSFERLLRLSPLQIKLAASESYIPRPLRIEYATEVLLARHLRFCPVCISLGYHTELYQIAFLRCCPIHFLPLEESCPSCLRNVTPAYSDLSLASAFGCPCGRIFFNLTNGTGMRSAVSTLNTSSVERWVEWCDDWCLDDALLEVDCSTESMIPYRGVDSVNRAFSALWSIKKPEGWSESWVFFSRLPAARPMEFVGESQEIGDQSDPGYQNSFSVSISKRGEEILDTLYRLLERDHWDCLAKYSGSQCASRSYSVADCQLVSAYFRWQGFWNTRNIFRSGSLKLGEQPDGNLEHHARRFSLSYKLRKRGSFGDSAAAMAFGQACLELQMLNTFQHFANENNSTRSRNWHLDETSSTVPILIASSHRQILIWASISLETVSMIFTENRRMPCNEGSD